MRVPHHARGSSEENSGAGRRARMYDRRHEFVRHSAAEYVRGDIYTQSIESFWSLLKRGVIGTYHHASENCLPLS